MMTDPDRRHADPHPQRRRRAQGERRRAVVAPQGGDRARAGRRGLPRRRRAWSRSTPRNVLRIGLRYDAQRRPVITGIHRVSRPSLRVYVGAERDPGRAPRPRRQRPLHPEGHPRRPRGARARTSAARSSARSGRSETRCRASDRLPITMPAGREASHVADGSRARRGPEGHARARALEPEVDDRGRGQHGASCSGRTTRARARSVHGLTRKLVANMVAGRRHGLHARARDQRRRLPRRGARQRALPHPRLLAPDRLPAARRASPPRSSSQVVVTLEGARPRAARRRPRPRSASCGRPSRTRARASSTPSETHPPEGRQGGGGSGTLMRTNAKRSARERRRARVRRRRARHGRAAAAVGVPQRPAHLRRRWSPTSRGKTLLAVSTLTAGAARAARRRRPTSTPPSRSGCSPRGAARRRASRASSSTATASSTTAACARSPTAPARAACEF